MAESGIQSDHVDIVQEIFKEESVCNINWDTPSGKFSTKGHKAHQDTIMAESNEMMKPTISFTTASMVDTI